MSFHFISNLLFTIFEIMVISHWKNIIFNSVDTRGKKEQIQLCTYIVYFICTMQQQRENKKIKMNHTITAYWFLVTSIIEEDKYLLWLQHKSFDDFILFPSKYVFVTKKNSLSFTHKKNHRQTKIKRIQLGKTHRTNST